MLFRSVTAFDHFDYAREAIRLGVDEYLVKPASPDEIRGTVTRIADRIVEAKLGRIQDGSTGSTDQKALELLEQELRSDLARGDINSQRMISFLRLKGLGLHLPVAAIIRLPSTCLPESSIRQAQLRRVRDLLEHQAKVAGNYVLAGTNGAQLHCIFIRLNLESWTTDRASALAVIKAAFQKVVDEARTILGLRILIGASPFLIHDEMDPATEAADPFTTAADALSIAGTRQAVVLMATALSRTSDTSSPGSCQGSSTVERAIDYMQKHLSNDISLVDVAEAVGTAPSHLSRLFSRYSGDTFIHVLCRLRIDTAKELLRTNQYRIKEVYTMVGFNDQAYFSRVFKKYEGISPQDYRVLPD